jgi:dTDP-4-dehydrorhamnose reductase
MTRFTMLALLAEQFQLSGGKMAGELQGCSIDDFPTQERRPRDVSMVCEKLVAAIGFTPRTVPAIVQETVECATTGR